MHKDCQTIPMVQQNFLTQVDRVPTYLTSIHQVPTMYRALRKILGRQKVEEMGGGYMQVGESTE